MEKSERIKDKIYQFLKHHKDMYSVYDLARELKLGVHDINTYIDEMVEDNSIIKYARGGRSLIKLKKEY